MANLSMRCHPATPAIAVDSITVSLGWCAARRLRIRYHVACAPASLVLPVADEPLRADGLWATTCFELFLCERDRPGYFELNFAPSSAWAAYQFTEYRDGRSDWEIPAPRIECDRSERHFALEATVSLGQVPGASILAGASAVIEENGGPTSYWALAHPPGEPDFHHRDCFAFALAAPAAP